MKPGLNKRDTTSHLLDGALLEPITREGPIRLRRHAPGPTTAPFVRHFWFVSWELPAGQAIVQPVLPLPAVNAVVEEDGAWVYGVWSRRYDKALSGSGNAWGVLFQPTGFSRFSADSVHRLTDRRTAFAQVFRHRVPGGDGEAVTDALVSALRQGPSDADAVELLERYLNEQASFPEANAEVRAWVASVEQDPSLIRVEQLAQRHGVSVRTLQRVMRHHVGLAPKQLIRRYRLLEAASRLATGEPCNQVALALSLGYADQAHFNRDFRAIVGVTPGRQSKRVAKASRGAGGVQA